MLGGMLFFYVVVITGALWYTFSWDERRRHQCELSIEKLLGDSITSYTKKFFAGRKADFFLFSLPYRSEKIFNILSSSMGVSRSKGGRGHDINNTDDDQQQIVTRLMLLPLSFLPSELHIFPSPGSSRCVLGSR